MDVKVLAIAAAATAAAYQSASADATDWVRSSLSAAASDPDLCEAEKNAASATLSRLRGVSLPERGKAIVVNIPGGIVTAYLDGVAVLESRAVVGKVDTPTPELDTRVTYVRANPTWTVPQSIIRRNEWRERLSSDPAFFEDAGFDVRVSGRLVSPWEASADAAQVETFVQRPGPANALGAVKIGLAHGEAIYMHDTNDPGRFGDAFRAASAGCVRIDRVRELAAWILDVPHHEMDAMIDGGDMTDRRPPEPVAVVLGYWTAWPDDHGRLRFYEDIYGKDPGGASCSASAQPFQGYSEPPTWRGEPEGRPRAPGFVPFSDANTSPEPVWTEYIAR